MPLSIYDTRHATSVAVCDAMRQGTGARIFHSKRGLADENDAFFYGVLRGNAKLRKHCVQEGRTYFLADNGYMRAHHFDGYYRITRNNFLHSGRGEPDYGRLERLGVRISPWQKRGDYIVIIVPAPAYNSAWRFDGDAWVRRVKGEMRGHTKRPFVLRRNPMLDRRCEPAQPGLQEQLSGAWAVVTHDSNVAIDALLMGVPVFATGESPARRLGNTDLTQIDSPMYSDEREDMLAVLAANQWTLDELRTGQAWRTLQGL